MRRVRDFVEVPREDIARRAVTERIRDWNEHRLPVVDGQLERQAGRCMDCGVPFCSGSLSLTTGCPLSNLIADFNGLVLEGRWAEAARALHETNPMPEVTGRVCPAPCEASCVLSLETIETGETGETGRVSPGPVTIKSIEREIADRAIARGLGVTTAKVRSTKSVGVVGSGPAGLACAQALARKGHDVTVYERDARVGGLLRYGIPDFKLDKSVLDARLGQMEAEGVRFRTGVDVGMGFSAEGLLSLHDAVVLCTGSPTPRGLSISGAEGEGVHFAMEFLTQQNRRVAGESVDDREALIATGLNVVVLGGGDTGSDCVGTALRQNARSVTSFELLSQPPARRGEGNPWPEWPMIFRESTSHEEGGDREFSTLTTKVRRDRDKRVTGLEVVTVERASNGGFAPIEGTERTVDCDLVLLALGFVGAQPDGVATQLGLSLDARRNIRTDGYSSSVKGVFAAGDARRGQSLVVWALAEGRAAAEKVDRWLGGSR